uniref:Uncharacterized protein n=1 Tax=Anguilla anguilla TaxID=7936 RepID=A0A0E9XLJ6_ANGAN
MAGQECSTPGLPNPVPGDLLSCSFSFQPYLAHLTTITSSSVRSLAVECGVLFRIGVKTSDRVWQPYSPIFFNFFFFY